MICFLVKSTWHKHTNGELIIVEKEKRGYEVGYHITSNSVISLLSKFTEMIVGVKQAIKPLMINLTVVQ